MNVKFSTNPVINVASFAFWIAATLVSGATGYIFMHLAGMPQFAWASSALVALCVFGIGAELGSDRFGSSDRKMSVLMLVAIIAIAMVSIPTQL